MKQQKATGSECRRSRQRLFDVPLKGLSLSPRAATDVDVTRLLVDDGGVFMG